MFYKNKKTLGKFPEREEKFYEKKEKRQPVN